MKSATLYLFLCRQDAYTTQPMLQLFDTPQQPDAFHNVRAPGGYEWWYFDAEDAKTDTQIVCILLHGFVFHPGYLRAYAKFVKRPTKVRPPVASDFPCAYFVVYRAGKILHQFMTQYPASDFSASTEMLDVIVGANRLQTIDDTLRLTLEGTPWKLTWQGPKTLAQQTLSADFIFAPRFEHAPAERTFLSRPMTGADHHWVIANPLCDVRGAITLRTGEHTTERIDFTGLGYHDHNYGTGPLGPGLAKWIWGRVILPDRVLAFHYAIPRDKKLKPEVHVMSATQETFEPLHVDVLADWSKRTPVGLAYPSRLQFGDLMTLHTPRVIDSAPFYMRLQYEVTMHGKHHHPNPVSGKEGTTTAFCEVAYPHRLRWPVLGRMIEMSIDKRR